MEHRAILTVFSSLQQNLKTQIQQTTENNRKRQYNNTCRNKPNRGTQTYAQARRTIEHPLCPRDSLQSCQIFPLVSPNVWTLKQNRTTLKSSKLQKYVGWQFLLSICNFGTVAVWDLQHISSPPCTCCRPVIRTLALSLELPNVMDFVTPGRRPLTQSNYNYKSY